MSQEATAFDRASHFLQLPQVQSTNVSTIQDVDALFGRQVTWIVQTARHCEEGWRLFLQCVDTGEPPRITQLIVPNKVYERIIAQRRSLVDRARRKPKVKLTREQRDQLRVREARRVLREARKNGRT